MVFHSKSSIDRRSLEKSKILFMIERTSYSSERDEQSDYEIKAVLNNTVLYNAMIHPFTRMVIKGAIWYQGIKLTSPTKVY